MGDVDAADDQGEAGLEAVQVEAMADPEGDLRRGLRRGAFVNLGLFQLDGRYRRFQAEVSNRGARLRD